MKTQMFIVIAVVASSLLTMSDRASAADLNKHRYVQTNIEQFFFEDVAPDQDNETIDDILAPSLLAGSLGYTKEQAIFVYPSPHNALLASKLGPRAPPFS